MGAKRKSADRPGSSHDGPNKKAKQTAAKEHRAKLVFEPRPDWHAADLGPIDTKDVTTQPPQHAVEALYKHAESLLQADSASYNASHAGSSQHKFLSTIMSSGTLEDKISALTLLVQESPLHTSKAFENLIGLAKKKSRNQALMAVAALKDLLGQGVVLPADRKLRAFGKQPGVLAALQGRGGRWREGDPLPGGLDKKHLISWAFEDWLKKEYYELLQILEGWCNDEVAFARSRAITYVYELLKDKPEQEENLLRLLVNKLGDTDRKIASRASYLLLQLENTHPAMRLVVTNSVEADCLMRPGQSQHAKYYAIITLNQTVLSQKEEAVANRLLEIYFGLFVLLLKPTSKTAAHPQSKFNGRTSQQGGGGKAGKLAAKKQKAQERVDDAEVQLGDKMVAQVLTGVNRAFPFADTSDPTFEKSLDTIFRVAHSSNFNTAVQALMLLQQISSKKHYGAERFYRTLYDSLLDPRLYGSSKQVMYLNLLYKSLKQDLNAKRAQAFVKRLLQTITMHDPPFACGVLYLISELESTFPTIRKMITEAEWTEEDEEEHFVDAPEDGAPEDAPSTGQLNGTAALQSQGPRYDPRKRDPEHAHAERSCVWELLPFVQHFHPSVALFAECLLLQRAMPPKPDTTQHTLMQFLDRFVYKNAKSKAAAPHGTSIMQPLVGSNAADLLVKPGDGDARAGVPVNSEQFWTRKAEEVAPEDAFFHTYFSQAGKQKKKGAEKKVKKARAESDESDDEGEEEIWQAIAQSRPDVEGPDEDDDISLGDLESAYDKSDEESDAGLDLGGRDDDGDSEPGLDLDGEDEQAERAVGGADEDLDDMDGFPGFDDSDDEAMLGSDDDVPIEVDYSDDEESEAGKEGDGAKAADVPESRWKQQRKEKKKLKALPTFASAEDYAKLLADEPEDFSR
ncbi:hypothetical protein B0A50_06057 [Salinomyces thailandicus]|uniref:CCAAT-binding factor domain-containing protein n=1 Tax=Salinomyces thailandicus TaxID=706561 RepID=A0A4V5N690_9PEZI|nr:hypothetical protein B0A50_06057 [Salinomyces thailandica]